MEERKINFKEYEEIVNHYGPDGLGIIKHFQTSPELKNTIWVATEKIHGCNFCFITNGTEIQCGKRNSVLKPNESFNNFQVIYQRYKLDVNEVYKAIQKDIPDLELIRIYGQFYGGVYDGIKSNFKAIFKEVKYSPDLEFEAFDISFKTSKMEKELYMNYDRVVEYLKAFKIPYAEVLHRGTIDEIMKILDVDKMESNIYKKIRNGELKKLQNNFAEGVVVKPVDNTLNPESGQRYVIQVKSKNFKEKREEPVVKEKAPKKTEEKKEISPEVAALVEEAAQYVNKNRLDSVLSKLSDDGKTDKNVSSLLMQDTWKDFEKEFKGDDKQTQKELINKNRGVIMQRIQDEITELLKEHPVENKQETN